MPILSVDSFTDWNNVSVARAIEYSTTVSLARYLERRENLDPELTPDEIAKFQQLLYEECVSTDEKKKISFDEFIDNQKKGKKHE